LCSCCDLRVAQPKEEFLLDASHRRKPDSSA
jgi:hypothetical protein